MLLFPNVAVFASNDTFNANHIISDEELQDWQSMTRGDIQAFLEDKGGYIASLRADDAHGKQRRISDIIYLASKEYRINPKYLLVKLQKEQSLITTKNPSQKQLDGATGYGIADSCAFSCTTYLNNQGIGKQIDSAAGIMRWYYDNADFKSWIKKPYTPYTIDGQTVTPLNLATAFLYTYTPHIVGNKNFFTLWTTWFQQVYPNGSLVKTASDNTIYLVEENTRRPFTNMTALITRFDPKMILTIPEAELEKFELGASISLPNYSILKAGSTYYLLDFDMLRPFASRDVVRQLGYNPDEIIDVSAEDIGGYALGTVINTTEKNPLGRLIRIEENGSMYYLKDSEYHPILDKKIADINFPTLTFETVTVADLKSYVSGSVLLFKDGVLFGSPADNEIFVVENGKKRHIATEEVFNSLRYDWKNIVWINEFATLAHPRGTSLNAVISTTIPVSSDIASSNTPDPSVTIVEPSSTKQPNPVGITITPGKMVTTPTDQTQIIGPTFDTKMDGYLIATARGGEILAGKNIDTVRPTASLAKVMTGYELLNQGMNINGSVVYDPTEHKATNHYYLVSPGDRIRNRDLFFAGLISSLNTPIRMAVDGVQKDEPTFIKQVNIHLASWGLTHTYFTSVTGEDEYTVMTAREYLTLFTNALKNATLKEILGMASYTYTELENKGGTAKHQDQNSNPLMQKTDLPFTIISSKTGYLNESGEALAMLVKRKTDAKEFVIITMGNPESRSKDQAVVEPERLARWAMTQF